MSEDGKLLMALIGGVVLVAMSVVAGVTAVHLNRGWLDGGYITIDGKQMR